MKGNLANYKGEPINEAKLSLNYEDESKNREIDIVTDDGSFAVAVNMEKEEKVVVTLEKEGTAYQSRLVKSEEAKGGVIKNRNIEVKPLEKGQSFDIKDIVFATNSFELNEDAQFILTNFLQYLKKNPSIKFRVVGHTDDIGDASQNQVLSANRANSVKQFLEDGGINSSRISSAGKGETKPKVPNTSDENRQINRRTEIIVLSL